MNNNQSSSKKTLIIFIVIIVLGVLGYFYYLGNSSDAPSDLSTEAVGSVSNETEVAGARVLSLLGQVSSLKIDKSVFESAVYKSLVDYAIEIPDQNVGRFNPFEPIGGTVVSTQTNNSATPNTAPTTPVKKPAN